MTLCLRLQISGMALVATCFFPTQTTFSQEPSVPIIAEASDEGIQAISGFKFPPNLKAELFAAEPDIGNPVAFYVDFQGRVFVCETFRQEKGVEDNRNHEHWLDEDLAAQSIDDRLKYIKRHFPDADQSYTYNDDRIRLLRDRDGDGQADETTVFADHFNQILDGTGAGVFSYRGNVYYTCIPHLWMLNDADQDGISDSRKSMHTGFGVRFAFRGHDMHGLILGPDGRLYFSIGDRGYNVSDQVRDPASGAVFRCELDGSQLEVVATGLRNPQELAFDNYGNLFTGDNNSDSGDRARWVFVVPGGDSGWRMYYQYVGDRGPFNREKIWHPFDKSVTPGYIVPPITNLSDGPSGLAFYPGTGFGDFFKDRFFLADFRGAAAHSGIRSFRNKPKGAFFEVVDMDQTIWKTLPTDIDFGPDGKLYMSDWVFGWIGENKGRIYTFHDPEHINSRIVNHVQALLKNGLKNTSRAELAQLLGHADRRIRMEAQFELVARNDIEALALIASSNANQMSRIHALWGIAQYERKNQETRGARSYTVLIENLLNDADAEIRAQAARFAGDSGAKSQRELVASKLQDANNRVRYFAALSLAAIGTGDNLNLIAESLIENDDNDPILRHGLIMALTGILGRSLTQSESNTFDIAAHPSEIVRRATVVALRKIVLQRSKTAAEDPTVKSWIGKLVADKDRTVALEAARVIHDVPLATSMNALAKMLNTPNRSDHFVRRAMNANVVGGTVENAVELANFIGSDLNNKDRRLDAIRLLADWGTPKPRDYVLGDWRPIETRDASPAQIALEQIQDRLFTQETFAAATIRAGIKLNIKLPVKVLTEIIFDAQQNDDVRVAALQNLKQNNQALFSQILEKLNSQIADLPDQLTGKTIAELSVINAPLAITSAQSVLSAPKSSYARKQRVYKTLGSMSDTKSEETLLNAIELALNNDVAPETRLDIVMAAEQRTEDSFKHALAKYRKRFSPDDSNRVNMYADSKFGGNLEAGKKIFFERTSVSCVRCHMVGDIGGAVGPVLTDVATKRDRDYLLESIVEPNKTVAEEFNQIVVLTVDGELKTGIIKAKTKNSLTLLDADGKLIKILNDDIESTRVGKSAMPEDVIKHLTPAEIRDLVEFLAHLKPQAPADKEPAGKHGEN